MCLCIFRCVCVDCKISPLQHKTIHAKGMKVVGNVIETCDKEAGQKLLLKGSHVHHLKHLEKMQGENNFRKPQATRGRSAFLVLCLCMTLIIVLSGTQQV